METTDRHLDQAMQILTCNQFIVYCLKRETGSDHLSAIHYANQAPR
jgi:hypothetical protein